MVLLALLTAGFLDGGALLDALVVRLPLDLGVRREGEDTFHDFTVEIQLVSQSTREAKQHNQSFFFISFLFFSLLLRLLFYVPNFEHPAAIRLGPDAENVLAVTHAEHGATDLVRCLTKLVADESEQQVLPVAVGNALLHAYDPLAARLVLLVLPNGTHAFLEQVIVRNERQGRWPLEVAVDLEELLGRLARRDRVERLLVLDEPVGLADGRPEPEHPGAAQPVHGRPALRLLGRAGRALASRSRRWSRPALGN